MNQERREFERDMEMVVLAILSDDNVMTTAELGEEIHLKKDKVVTALDSLVAKAWVVSDGKDNWSISNAGQKAFNDKLGRDA